jgi:hypothetical protein
MTDRLSITVLFRESVLSQRSRRRKWTLGMAATCAALLASVLASPQAIAEQTAHGNTVPVFVPLPKDVQCEADGISIRTAAGQNARSAKISGSVMGLTCWIIGKTPERRVQVPLGSTDIAEGLLATKDFGKLQITSAGGVSGRINIAIRLDRSQSLRTFVQRQEAEAISAERRLAELADRAWAVIQDENPNPAELSDALGAVAKADLLEKANAEGVTLLNKSAQLGRRSACEQLAQLGANPNAADRRGRSALSFAAATLPDLYDLLVSKGGNERAPDADGLTPAEIAGRFLPWKSIEGPVDEPGLTKLRQPWGGGPLSSAEFRVQGESFLEATKVVPVAGDFIAPVKVRLSAHGSDALRAESNTGMEMIQGGSERCFPTCLILPYGSEVELVTRVHLWGKQFGPGTLRLQSDGVHFAPSNAPPPNIEQ